MKEPKNYVFFLLGSYHWFMYLTFLLVTVQFQVCLLRKTGQNKENFKSRRQIDNSTVNNLMWTLVVHFLDKYD